MNLKEALKGKLTDSELKLVNRSFEVIGDIAIIDVPPEIEDKKMIVAKTLMEINKHVKVVLRKTGDVSGKYRVGQFEILIGDRTHTIYTENYCRFKIDPTYAYFSSKLGYERKRITDQVKDGEKILCMFAGAGPYPINVAKTKEVSITAIEINPKAVELFIENIKLNKVEGKVNAICGDVATEVPKLKGKFDRILMPAPKDAESYLDIALSKVKKGGIINLYTFVKEEDLGEVAKRITRKCSELGYKIKVTEKRICGDIGPYCHRVVCDFKIL